MSKEKKDNLQKIIYFQFIKSILEIFLIILSIAGIILLGGQTILQNYLDDLDKNISSIKQSHEKTNQEILQINNTLLQSEKIQKEYYSYYTIITKIGSATPSGINLNQLKINIDEKILTISGKSIDRNNLLNLKNNLEKIEEINNIEIPISQLTQEKDFDFSLQIPLEI